MDGTTNEHSRISIKGFPTIKLFKPEKNEFKDYDGQRTLEGFISYLEKETGLPVKELKEAAPEVVTEEL